MGSKWPWNVAIYQLNRRMYRFKCAGTLIHPRTVLTSALCVKENNRRISGGAIQVELGTAIKNSNADDPNVQLLLVIFATCFQITIF